MTRRCKACPQPLFRKPRETAKEFGRRLFCCARCRGKHIAARAAEELAVKVAALPIRHCAAPGCGAELRFRQNRADECLTAFSTRTTCSRKCAAAVGVVSRERPRASIEAQVIPLLVEGLPMTEITRRVGTSMHMVRAIAEENSLRTVKRRLKYLPRESAQRDLPPPPPVSPRQVREFWQTPLSGRALFAPEVRAWALEVGP